jgi:predicted transcriptional regulator
MLRKRKSIKRNKKKREKEKRGKKLEDIIEKKLKKEEEERWHLFRKPLLTTRGLVSRFVLQSIISYDSNL